jgi:UDP:flavonoid glycosyltransferase YjiC (YdhE family)
MKIGIITTGTRGDIQPFISLSVALLQRGHHVTFIAPSNFKNFIESFNIKFVPLSVDFEEIICDPIFVKLLNSGNGFKYLKYFRKKVTKSVREKIGVETLDATRGVDYLISNTINLSTVYSIGEKFDKKVAVVSINMPSTPTTEFPFLTFKNFKSPWLNKFSYNILRLFWLAIKKETNEYRSYLGLPKLNFWKTLQESNILTIYPMSPLISRPMDWPSNTHVTGFFNMPVSEQQNKYISDIPAGLEEWLKIGDSPIYIGFGSMPIPDPSLFSAILNEILITTDLRFVFGLGWSSMPDLLQHSNLFVVKNINHQWLLPQCKAAIFHGGIGTVAAVMRAKIPSIVLSIFSDQPSNGIMMQNIHIAIHIPFTKISTKKILSAIEKTQTPLMIESAKKFGDIVIKENGLIDAVDLIEAYFDKPPDQKNIKA